MTYNAIKISSGNSFVNETETKVILSGSYDVGFTMDLVNKDLSLFKKLSKEYSVPIKLGDLINKIFKNGMKKLGRRSFSTSIVKLIENDIKTKFRASNFPKKLIDTNSKQKGIKL